MTAGLLDAIASATLTMAMPDWQRSIRCGPRRSRLQAKLGARDAPAVVLLHGFPTSSHMFRNLIPALADRYHVIAPDYPGYGQSAMPDHDEFAYTFDHFAELRTNLPLYPAVQAYFRERQPPTLIVWGKNDKIFPADGAYPYQRDLRDLEFHLLDTGHFALEDKAAEMVPLIHDFLDRKVAPKVAHA